MGLSTVTSSRPIRLLLDDGAEGLEEGLALGGLAADREKPLMPSCLRATLVAAAHLASLLLPKAFFERRLAFFDTILPVLLFMRSAAFRPPLILALVPLKTLTLASLPL